MDAIQHLDCMIQGVMDAIESLRSDYCEKGPGEGDAAGSHFSRVGSGRFESNLFEGRFKCRWRNFECLVNRVNIKKTSRECYGSFLS